MLAVIGIVVVLATTLASAYQANISRFEMPRCLANMRTLHTALNTYIQDQKHWPQVPPELGSNNDSEYDFWIKTLEPYGMLEKSWHCPTLKRMLKEDSKNNHAPRIHYMPALFDEHELTPFKWPNMPWAAEGADVHGKGILRLYSDGSIRPFTEFRDNAGMPSVEVNKNQ